MFNAFMGAQLSFESLSAYFGFLLPRMINNLNKKTKNIQR